MCYNNCKQTLYDYFDRRFSSQKTGDDKEMVLVRTERNSKFVNSLHYRILLIKTENEKVFSAYKKRQCFTLLYILHFFMLSVDHKSIYSLN